MAKTKVRIKQECSHRLPPAGWKGDPTKPGIGKHGELAQAGDEIEVTEAELESFSDKFEVLKLPAGE